MEHLRNVRPAPDGLGVIIIDQTLLPGRLEEITLKTAEEMYEAIRLLRVRGAPAIGIFAAYSLAVLAKSLPEENFLPAFDRAAEYLNSSRPTAVNLSWACRRMQNTARRAFEDHPARLAALWAEAEAVYQEDIAMCRAIAENGLSLIRDGAGVLTHCNAGPLATSRYGTALGPLLLGREKGMQFHVFADETRPLLQGARLTAYELDRAGVDVTLICDNMASLVMKQGKIDAVFVGCDRVAANGDAANKIGTSGVAILAKHYGIPFYVLGPGSTIDLNTPTGAEIRIEERDPEEIRSLFYEKPMAPAVKCYNPAFDVTDHTLITAIVTEKGVIYPPFEEKLADLFGKK